MLLTCLVLHAPIAVQNLSGSALADYGPSVRLFHLAMAVPFIVVAIPLLDFARAKSQTFRASALLCVGVLVLAATVQSNGFARDWSIATNGSVKHVVIDVAEKISRRNLPDTCRIVVTGTPEDAADFLLLGDVMIKAISTIAPHRLLRCVVLTERAPHFALVARDLCSREPWLPLQPIHPLVQPHPFGSLCYQFFATPDMAALAGDTRTVTIRYGGP